MLFLEIPNKVSSLRVNKISNTSMTLSWQTKEKYFLVIKYYILLFKQGSSKPLTVTLKSSSNKVIMENLDPFTSYTLLVKAANKYHNSTASTAVFVRTEEGGMLIIIGSFQNTFDTLRVKSKVKKNEVNKNLTNIFH